MQDDASSIPFLFRRAGNQILGTTVFLLQRTSVLTRNMSCFVARGCAAVQHSPAWLWLQSPGWHTRRFALQDTEQSKKSIGEDKA